MFSLTALLENVFKGVYPRHLSGDHTHLYTKKSLEYLAKKNKLKIIGEWWFGADIPDLFRSLLISSNYLNKQVYVKELNKIYIQLLMNCKMYLIEIKFVLKFI